VSTHPPFDPELSAAMAALPAEDLQPLRAGDILARRELAHYSRKPGVPA
jgi:hypothetical protein